jgi:hypothetical protein
MNNPANLALKVILDEDQREIVLPVELIEEAAPLLAKMDEDMKDGWQIGRRYVDAPDNMQRCQVAADRLLSALHTDNQASITLMCAYILTRLDGAAAVFINSDGEPGETLFYNSEDTLIT